MLIITMMPYIALAEVDEGGTPEIVNSGSCGDAATWELDSEGTLTISGTGAIDSFDKAIKKTLKANTANIIISEGITSIEDWAFDGFSKLTNITIPCSVEEIGYGAFYGCKSLSSVDIPDGVTVVDDWAFTNCSNITDVTMADSVEYLGEKAFNSCSKLSQIKLSNSLTEIKESTFVGCVSLKSIDIPQGITTIGDYAFRNCTSLTEVVVPNGVTEIGDYAFDKCTGLTRIMIPKSVTRIGNSAVVFKNNITVFGVKDSLAQKYAADNKWLFYYIEHLQCISDGLTTEAINIKKAGFNTAGVRQRICENCGSTNQWVIPAAKSPVVNASAYTYNKKTKTPKVKVYNKNGAVIPATVSYPKGRKNVGKYTLRVTINNGEYSGTTTASFKINPKGVSVSKLYRYRKALKVKWKKPSSTYRKQMSGYQIRYSTSSKMKKAKTVTVKSTKATSKKIKKLKAKKYYYVQLRTYKTVKGVRYYSGWSKAKRIKTK